MTMSVLIKRHLNDKFATLEVSSFMCLRFNIHRKTYGIPY